MSDTFQADSVTASGRFLWAVSRRSFPAAAFPSRETIHFRPRAIEPLEPRTLLAASLLDPPFGGSDGIASADFSGGEDRTADVAVIAGGKIVVAATVQRPGAGESSSDFALTRFHPDGTLDTTFGTGGKVATDFHKLADVARAMAVLPDGKIVVVGAATRVAADVIEENIAVARYNADGSLDRTFDGDGKAVLDVADRDAATSVAVLPDGDIVVAGHAYTEFGYERDADLVVVRYNANGTRDAAFGRGGVVTTDLGEDSFDGAQAVAALPGGKILAAGGARADVALFRFDDKGTPDATFGEAGVVTDDIDLRHNVAMDFSILPDGDVLVSGQSTDSGYYGGGDQEMIVVRYNADGSRDRSFGDAGVARGARGATGGSELLLLPGGRFLVGDNSQGGIARFEADGSPDTTFDGDDGLAHLPGAFVRHGLALQGNRPIVGVSSSGASDAAVARLKASPPVAQDPDDAMSEARTISSGAPQSQELDQPTDVDLFKFTTSDEAWVQIDLDVPSGISLDTVVRLFDGDGAEVASNDDGPAPGEQPGTHESYLRRFVRAGTYYVGVSSSPNASYRPGSGTGDVPGGTGRYTVSITATAPPADGDDQISEARSLSVGGSRSGAISPETDVDVYKFTAGAGQVIAFDVDLPRASNFSPLLRVFAADGRPINPELSRQAAPGEVDDGGEAYAEYRFDAAGTYHVGLSAGGNAEYNPVTGRGDEPSDTGDYTLRLSAVPPDRDDQMSEAVRTTVGGPAVTGRVSSFGDVDLFSMTAVAGRPIAIDLDRTGTVSWGSALILFNDAGEAVASSFGFSPPDEAPSPDAYLEYVPSAAGT